MWKDVEKKFARVILRYCKKYLISSGHHALVPLGGRRRFGFSVRPSISGRQRCSGLHLILNSFMYLPTSLGAVEDDLASPE
jgi:hypothetical protein